MSFRITKATPIPYDPSFKSAPVTTEDLRQGSTNEYYDGQFELMSNSAGDQLILKVPTNNATNVEACNVGTDGSDNNVLNVLFSLNGQQEPNYPEAVYYALESNVNPLSPVEGWTIYANADYTGQNPPPQKKFKFNKSRNMPI